jgi:hypothetical protein
MGTMRVRVYVRVTELQPVPVPHGTRTRDPHGLPQPVQIPTYILPTSVDSYLSGICHNLEDDFPDVRTVRTSRLLQCTIAGCKRHHHQPVHRVHPLSHHDLHTVFLALRDSGEHDDLLFLVQLYVGFATLQRLGELVWPDALPLQSYSSVPLHHTVNLTAEGSSYTIPSSKSDQFGHGSTVLVMRSTRDDDCHCLFSRYLASRDRLFPNFPELWLHSRGHIPTRSWFMGHFHFFLTDPHLNGHSLRAGGATALALAGATPQTIQAAGRWSSDEFRKYICLHPFLLQALIHDSAH